MDDLFVLGEKLFISFSEGRLYFSKDPVPTDERWRRMRIPDTDDVALRAHVAIEMWELLLEALPHGRHLRCLGFLKLVDGAEEYRDYSDTAPGFIARELEQDILSGKAVDWKYIEFILEKETFGTEDVW